MELENHKKRLDALESKTQSYVEPFISKAPCLTSLPDNLLDSCHLISEQEKDNTDDQGVKGSTPLVAVHYVGKVRDVYTLDAVHKVILISTDRQSAFDRNLATIPYKGQVLCQISDWWFRQTAHLVPNHLISRANANTLVVKAAVVFPIEFVVRGYITGSTSTSMWRHYEAGGRYYCGHALPEGLVNMYLNICTNYFLLHLNSTR